MMGDGDKSQHYMTKKNEYLSTHTNFVGGVIRAERSF